MIEVNAKAAEEDVKAMAHPIPVVEVDPEITADVVITGAKTAATVSLVLMIHSHPDVVVRVVDPSINGSSQKSSVAKHHLRALWLHSITRLDSIVGARERSSRGYRRRLRAPPLSYSGVQVTSPTSNS